jgi:tRNA G18 (ribose-2'-O)-methylase SpoU
VYWSLVRKVQGLSKEMIEYCDKIVAIEQFGSTRSINVGAAAAIVMYEWIRQHKLVE